jgi:hypothetical protein
MNTWGKRVEFAYAKKAPGGTGNCRLSKALLTIPFATERLELSVLIAR